MTDYTPSDYQAALDALEEWDSDYLVSYEKIVGDALTRCAQTPPADAELDAAIACYNGCEMLEDLIYMCREHQWLFLQAAKAYAGLTPTQQKGD